MKFTDENGAEFEEVTSYDGVANRNIVIRPIVKAEPKWEVILHKAIWEPRDYGIEIKLGKLPKDQAQLIKAGIESVMEYITGGGDWSDVSTNIRAAKHSLKGDK